MNPTTLRNRIHDVLTTSIELRSVCQFSFVEYLAAFSVVLTLTHLAVPEVQAAREAARRSTCKNGLKQIGLSIHDYHETLNAHASPRGVPSESPETNPVESWFYLILPQEVPPAQLDSIQIFQPNPTSQVEFRLISKGLWPSNSGAETDLEHIF